MSERLSVFEKSSQLARTLQLSAWAEAKFRIILITFEDSSANELSFANTFSVCNRKQETGAVLGGAKLGFKTLISYFR